MGSKGGVMGCVSMDPQTWLKDIASEGLTLVLWFEYVLHCYLPVHMISGGLKSTGLTRLCNYNVPVQVVLFTRPGMQATIMQHHVAMREWMTS